MDRLISELPDGSLYQLKNLSAGVATGGFSVDEQPSQQSVNLGENLEGVIRQLIRL